MQVINRKDAWKAGKLRYFTGNPCKNGHIAERYVSNSCCTGCLAPYKARRNPYSKLLTPYVSNRLWIWHDLTSDEIEALEKYLQVATDAFCAHARPGVAVPATQVHEQLITPQSAPGAIEIPE